MIFAIGLANILYLSSQLTTSIHWPCYCTVRVSVLIQIRDSMWSCWVDQIHNTHLEYLMDACLMIEEHGECYCSSCLMIGEHGECHCSSRFKTTCSSCYWENGWYPRVYYYHWVDISDIHVFITITRSISLICLCLLLSLVDISDIHVFITITGRYLWYSCVYYYHWSISLISMCVLLSLVDISDIHVLTTITRSISLLVDY